MNMYYTARTTAILAASETIENRRPLIPLLRAALNTPGAAGRQLLDGTCHIIAQAIDALQLKGAAFKTSNARAREVFDALPDTRRFLLTAYTSEINQETGDLVAALASGLHEYRDCLFVTRREPPPPEPPRSAAEQQEPPVMRMEIVGMPERITETTVERNRDGDIRTTTQTEHDA